MVSTAATPTAGNSASTVGPFYRADEVAAWLGITTSELAGATDRLYYLGLPLSGRNGVVYPVWQFTTGHRTIPHLPDALARLATGTPDPWTWALWLTASDDAGVPTWQQLADSPDRVLAAAASDAARWTH